MDKIFIVSPYAHHAGHHWSIAKDLGAALAETGAVVEILLTGNPVEPIALEKLPCRVTLCAPGIAGARPGVFSRFIQRLSLGKRHNLEMLACVFKLLRMRTPVVHFIDATHLVLFLFVLFSGKRVFYTVWGTPDFTAPGKSFVSRAKISLTRWLLARAIRTDRFEMICETEAVRDAWHPFCGAHIHVIPYAIHLPAQRPDRLEARRQLELPVPPLILLMFGTHRAEKDYRVVFEAAKILPPGSVFLLFVGRVISGNNPLLLARQHPDVPSKIISDYVTDEEASLFFAACDAVVLPYETGFTWGSGVLLLACQHERPVIATKTGHLQQFVEKYRTGFLFAPGEPTDFAVAVKRIGTMSALERETLATHIRAAAKDFFWGSIVMNYLKLYRAYGLR
ncbi:MAG: glycosyltransferase family 4 protein [Phycisphaerae bacterium]|jgi:glycosyltransferase involved in cell wall biosynthesis